MHCNPTVAIIVRRKGALPFRFWRKNRFLQFSVIVPGLIHYFSHFTLSDPAAFACSVVAEAAATDSSTSSSSVELSKSFLQESVSYLLRTELALRLPSAFLLRVHLEDELIGIGS
jgi:hypothetical protein